MHDTKSRLLWTRSQSPMNLSVRYASGFVLLKSTHDKTTVDNAGHIFEQRDFPRGHRRVT